jgi:hypothetical protein
MGREEGGGEREKGGGKREEGGQLANYVLSFISFEFASGAILREGLKPRTKIRRGG